MHLNHAIETTTRPLFALYIVWHPSNENGGKVADLLRRHFGRDRHRSIAGDPGLSVIYRSEIEPGALVPLSIDWDEAEITAVVVLVDSVFARDTDGVDGGKPIDTSEDQANADCGDFDIGKP